MPKKYDNAGSGILSKSVIEKALKRLAELLKENNSRVELVAAGGVISVLIFESRGMTRDIDVIIPQKDKQLIEDLVNQVASEQNLPKGKHAWLNDGVSFFGLQTKSENTIFAHPNLTVYIASWYELLGMKLSGAWRRDADYIDAIHILRQIGDKNRNQTLSRSMKYKNLSPFVDDLTFSKRFDRTWSDAFVSD
jgi:hypothetical protein